MILINKTSTGREGEGEEQANSLATGSNEVGHGECNVIKACDVDEGG